MLNAEAAPTAAAKGKFALPSALKSIFQCWVTKKIKRNRPEKLEKVRGSPGRKRNGRYDDDGANSTPGMRTRSPRSVCRASLILFGPNRDRASIKMGHTLHGVRASNMAAAKLSSEAAADTRSLHVPESLVDVLQKAGSKLCRACKRHHKKTWLLFPMAVPLCSCESSFNFHGFCTL